MLSVVKVFANKKTTIYVALAGLFTDLDLQKKWGLTLKTDINSLVKSLQTWDWLKSARFNSRNLIVRNYYGC
jgi:hypothetical protein